MKVFRVVSLALACAAVIVCVIGVVAAARFAPPRAGERVSSLALVGVGESARIDPSDLACVEQGAGTICRATVRAQALTVAIEQEPASPWIVRSCVATYAGKSSACRAGSPPAAVIDAADLGLSDADLHQLRQQQPLVNWQAADWRHFALALALLVACGVALLAGNIPVPHLLGRGVVMVAGGLTTFLITWAALGLYIVSLGYID